ncbi:46 kDa FK506-binding nuclear protein isoform X1 [Nilaparvata lugens]|uniref:46 kDa FK506-binding nuclear protein isoform X1 n=1 Tax=Nilaparvata lugens TaxID=108931 RepID=UPI00193D7C29|nr:46 kDa FK506-binding nuclear protein isoform X1 [Nilaparvata lugens]
MFWGLILEPGKRYSTTVDKAFHVSMACLDCSSVNSDTEVLYVLLENDKQEYRICNLSKRHCFQVNLDLSFMTGDSIAFELKGSGIVHLSGYILPEEDDDFPGDEDDDDLDEIEDEEDESITDKLMLKGSKKALDKAIRNATKKQKLEESDDEDDEEDDDDDDLSADDDDEDDDEETEEEDDDEEEEEEDVDEEEVVKVVQKLKKGQQQQQQAQAKKGGQSPAAKGGKPQAPASKPQTPASKPQTPTSKPQTPAGKMLNGTSPDNQQQSGKKRKRKSKGGAADQQQQSNTPNQQKQVPNQQQQQQQNSQQKNKAKKQRLSNGLTIKDLKVGNGPAAKPGQTVSVWYEGRLQSTGRTFDSCRRGGAPFKFRLGRNEVIKAWDEGVAGMKVGGQRTIVCPPNLAYGSRGAPPAIPPNSTLVFQVELKAVQ